MPLQSDPWTARAPAPNGPPEAVVADPFATPEHRQWVERIVKDCLAVWRPEQQTVRLETLVSRLVGLHPEVYRGLTAGNLGAALWSGGVCPVRSESDQTAFALRLADLVGALTLKAPQTTGPDRVGLSVTAPDRHTPVVYFVERDGFIKIGTTGRVPARIAELSRGDTAGPGLTLSPVKLLAMMPGDGAVESAVHGLFRSLRRDGEWFLAGEPLLTFVQAVADAGHVPARASESRRRARTTVQVSRHHSSLAISDAAMIRRRWPSGLTQHGSQRLLRSQLGWHAAKATNALRAYRDDADLVGVS